MMQLIKLLRFVLSHPLNRNDRIRAISRLLRWQVASRLLPEASFLLPFVASSGLLVRRGMTGATGNWYCGLDEAEDMGLVLHALRPGELFLDVGANIGSYSILAAAGVGARVHAIEPILDTFNNLMANISINNLDKLIHAHRLGLSDKEGHLFFTSNHDTLNHVLAAGEEATREEIPVTTMDELCKYQLPTLVKIDVEGHELAVLRGAKKIMTNPNLLGVIIELNGSGARYGIEDTDIDAWMIDKGFERCSYSPLDRKLSYKETNFQASKTSGNSLYVRDFKALATRVSTAPQVEIVNFRI